MAGNPVMFVVEVGSVYTTLLLITSFGSNTGNENVFNIGVAVFLWFTVLFANFAEAMAEGRGKAQADTLRQTRSETTAFRRTASGEIEEVASSDLHIGDEVVVDAGQVIPSDGDIIDGVASVDESAITGESAPVIRESGGDRSAVTGGTRVLSDHIVVRISAEPGKTFLDRMISLVEGADRQKTPNEIALSILLAGLTIIFLLAVVTLQPFADLLQRRGAGDRAGGAPGLPHPDDHRRAAVGHRDRGHGSPGPAQRPRHVGSGRRGRRRRVDPVARQDRHNHVRQSSGVGAHRGPRGHTNPSSLKPRCSPRWRTRPPRVDRSSPWRSRSWAAAPPRPKRVTGSRSCPSRPRPG